MKLATMIALMLALTVPSGCQSVKAERKNDCACAWESLAPLSQGVTA